MTQNIVIVGGGTCGAAAAQTLRDEGFDGGLLVVGDEGHAPYERPPLSKDYLHGKRDRNALLLRPEDWYHDHDVELRLNTPVVAVDPEDSVVQLAAGERLGYDRLLIATGGTPRRLPGVNPDAGHYLRTVDDADRLRARLSDAGHVVVVGAGFIGLEVAAAARQAGVAVTVLESVDIPLAGALGPTLGEVFAAIHRDEGVDLRTGEAVTEIRAADGGYVVRTTKDTILNCGLVVIGAGIIPATGFLAGSGLEIDNGVVVDEYGRTNRENIYAAGDVANHLHPLLGKHVRVEHHDNALRHGRAVARNMLGAQEPYDDPHWFWSDQYLHSLQVVGRVRCGEQLVIRGSVQERRFVAFFLTDRKVVAAVGLNARSDILAARTIVRRRTVVDPAKLVDEDVDLRILARPPATSSA